MVKVLSKTQFHCAATTAITLRGRKKKQKRKRIPFSIHSIFRYVCFSLSQAMLFSVYALYYRWIERRDIHFVSFDGDETQTRAHFSLPSLFLSVRLWISPADNYNEWTTGVRSVCSRLSASCYIYVNVHILCIFLRMLSLPRNFNNALSVFPHKMNDIRMCIRSNKKRVP